MKHIADESVLVGVKESSCLIKWNFNASFSNISNVFNRQRGACMYKVYVQRLLNHLKITNLCL